MGTWLILNIVFVFEFEWDKCAVLCRDILPGSLPDIYIGTPHGILVLLLPRIVILPLSDLRLERPASVSAERSDCVKQTVCANRSSLLAVGPCRSKKSTLVIIARSARDASIYDKGSTQRVQRIKA